MDSAPNEGGDSLGKDNFSRPSTSEQVVPGKIQIESVSDGERQDSSVETTMSEVTPAIDTECTEESEIPCSTDYDEFFGEITEISQDVFESSQSETVEVEAESQRFVGDNVLGNESSETSSHGQSASEGIKIQPNDGKTSKCKEKTNSKTEKQEDMAVISQKRRWLSESKDQYCQANCSPDNARNEVKILKEKLAISKKDTDTMQKLLEDVRKDYEELQKSFEKRESDVKTKVPPEDLLEESDDSRKEKAERKRGKTSKRRDKVSSSDEKNVARSSEKRKSALDKGSLNSRDVTDLGEMACPCFVQSIRKIVTDVREDCKDSISVLKQISTEQCTSIGNELTKLKDEYTCALEKKDSEIHSFEGVIKGLQARILEKENETVTFGATICSAIEEKQKLYDNIRGLKDQLLRVRYENETSQADLEKIKRGLKRYCTAQEYEELQRSDFKFSCDCSGVDGAQTSDECKVSELRSKETKFYPVLKKAKKEITKLKEEKRNAEDRLQEKISEVEELENYLNKKLKEALIEVKQNERGMAELKEHLVAIKLENAKLSANIDELEEEKEDLCKKHAQEMEAIKNKLKKSNESLQVHKVKSEQLQVENDSLNDSYLGLKSYLEDEGAKVITGMTKSGDYLSDDEDSTGQLLKAESLLQKQLEAEKEKNELCLKEIESLKKEVDEWKEMVRGDMDIGLGFLRIEIEDLKEEIQDNQILIKQLMSKKKSHLLIIKALRRENESMKRSLDIVPAEYDDILFDSDDQLDSEEPGYDITTTQEHRVRFDKNGKLEKPECPDDDDDSLFDEMIKHGVHFSEDENDFHNDSSLEFLEYDTSISEKE